MTNPEKLKTQVAVIGAGPGGYAAAFQAAELGLQVTLINAEPRPGGVCLLRGCIPSKAFLHVAKLINETNESSEWGIAYDRPKIDVDKLRAWKEGIVQKLSGGILQLCKLRGVRVIDARASFEGSNSLTLSASAESPMDIPRTVEFEHAIIATGSRPTIPAPFLIDDPRIMNSTSALDLPDIPGSLLVIGGGYIGLEIGTVYASLGSRVTVVEIADGLAPGADRDLIRPLQNRLDRLFESILLRTKVERLKPGKNGVVATLKGPEGERDVVFDRVLVSVGRRPNTSDLNLKATKVQLDEKGFIQVDKQMRTDDPRIFAIGDAAGEPLLAHKASREGKVAAEVIAGNPASFDSVAIPAVVFTDPEVAWCGLTENEARAKGIDIVVEKFPWAASGRALTIGRSDGLTKLIMDPQTERLLGVGIVGVGAGDLISEGVLAVEMAAVARDVADIIHPHPTLSETVAETAELFFGQATHVIRPKKER